MKPSSNFGASTPPELVSDAALELPEHDRLDRTEFAKAIARSILTLAADQPFTIGLHGPPGCGKSTVLNFVRYYLSQPARLGAGGIAADPVIVVSFNPSWFPDPARIAPQFFAQLGSALANAPGVSEPLQRASGSIERFAGALQGTVSADAYALKREIGALLLGIDTRILVAIDEIDRMDPAALAAFLNLISTAGLPRFLFLLSFDRDAVTQSLEAAHVGAPEAYLGKVIQLPFDVPEPDQFTLRQMLSISITDLFAGTPAELYNEADWEQFFWQGLDPLLTGPRDINRFVNALRSTYPSIKQEVNFVDFAAVQALRVFAPTMYRFLIANKPLLTGVGLKVEMNEKQARLTRIEAMKNALKNVSEEKREAVDHTLQCLFPEWETGVSSQRKRADTRARLERRVSSADVFDIYFNPNIPAGSLTRTEIRSILELAADATAFTERLFELAEEEGRAGKTRLDSFLEHMQDYTREEIPTAHIPAILKVIFTSGDRFCSKLEREPIPARRNDGQLMAIAAQLLQRLPDEATRADLLQQILPEANAIYVTVRFALRIDPENSRDAAGWSERTAQELRVVVLARIRALAADGHLAATPYLDTVFNVWESWSMMDEPREFAAHLAQTDAGVADLLLGAMTPLSPGDTHFSCNLDFLNRWTTLDFTELAPKCRLWLKTKPAWLTEARHVAIEAYVNTLGHAIGV